MRILISYPFSGSFPLTMRFGLIPSEEEIRKHYRKRGQKGHEGVDFGLPVGTEVLACAGGAVEKVNEGNDYGLSIVLKHKWGVSLYAHLSQVKVEKGQRVKRRALIGLSGASGFVTGPHLHFGIKFKGADLNNGYLGFSDPMPYFGNRESRLRPTYAKASVGKQGFDGQVRIKN